MAKIFGHEEDYNMNRLVRRSVALLFMVALVMSMLAVPASAAHSHDSSYWQGTGYCQTCGAFLPLRDYNTLITPEYYKVADGKTGYMRLYPYKASNDSIGQLLYTLKAGSRVSVIGVATNGLDNTWYHVWYDGKEGYIYSENLTYDGDIEETMTIDGVVAPNGDLRQGQGFGLRGKITSLYPITSVSAYIYYLNGPYTSTGYRPKLEFHDYSVRFRNTKTYDFRTDGLNSDVRFDELPKGDYFYVVTATNTVTSCPWTLVMPSLYQCTFTIK